MQPLGLSQGEFAHVVRVCERVLLGTCSSAYDYRHFLVARLREDFPHAAQCIADYDDQQLDRLRRDVERTLHAGTGAALR